MSGWQSIKFGKGLLCQKHTEEAWIIDGRLSALCDTVALVQGATGGGQSYVRGFRSRCLERGSGPGTGVKRRMKGYCSFY